MAKTQKLKKRSLKIKRPLPTLCIENNAGKKGYKCIAGIDEAGRGPLAGPVVAACVVIKDNSFTTRVDDSKKLTPAQREKAYSQIIGKAHVGVGIIFEDTIERINIRNATIMAMEQAFFNLKVKPDLLLIDGTQNIKLPTEQICIVGGDRKSLSIACSSIVAKVIRDRLMLFYDKIFTKWDFAAHKGYGTKIHFQAIKKHGLSPLHRKSFIG